MKKNNITALFIGFILLFLIVKAWTNDINNVQIGKEYSYRWNGYFSKGHSSGWNGNSPSMANSQRAGINTKYALWTFLVVLGVGGCLYANRSKNTNKDDIQSKIDSLKAQITDLENEKQNSNLS